MKVKRTLSLFAVVVLVIMSFAVAAYADEEVILPKIDDGRVNAFDIDAPVAVYELRVYPDAEDVDYSVLSSIEFWGIISDGVVDKVLEVSAADVEAGISASSMTIIAADNGYLLCAEVDDTLTLIAPNGYSFNWTPSL
ncbi:MAG: hypothetical protein IAE80_05725 [Anaerolinea sp.]|nr:hypothetical protein [Anaerolinea sp.]